MDRLYLGLDLGTTNSALAYGNLDKDGKLVNSILEVDRRNCDGRNCDGSMERKKTLPSMVMYQKKKEGFQIIVGDLAKVTYGKRYGYVSKSVKSEIGLKSEVNLNTDIEDRSPEAISSEIIKHMLINAQKQLAEKEQIKDLIITIPASFEPSQIESTLKAANLAGIEIDNKHDILLYEPKAVIYNLINMIDNNKIPKTVIDVSENKNILVFDLGGGTLDVTIHKVGYKKEMPEVEDIAISRYTKLGGDDFDEYIANGLLKLFEISNDIKIPQNRLEEVMTRMRKISEKLKFEVSEYYDRTVSINNEFDDEYKFEIDEFSVFDDYHFSEDISLGHIKDMYAPLMGNHLSLNDVKNIDKLKQSDINNLIYPILDTLEKAKNIKIDCVILNGGMTKFYPIQERINKFFGLESISITDPDLAVAMGASYYHYCLHRYNVSKRGLSDTTVKNQNEDQKFNTSTILNSTLSLGLQGEYIKELVVAGTKLPYETIEGEFAFKLGQYTDKFVLEIFSGRGKNKNLPNIKTVGKVIKLNKFYSDKTDIFIELRIDSLKRIRVEIIIPETMERHVVNIDGKNDIEENLKKIPKLESSDKIILNPISEINNLKDINKKTKVYINDKDLANLRGKALDIIKRIKNAENYMDFYEVIQKEIRLSKLNDFIRGDLYNIANEFIDKWSTKQQKVILEECERHFKPELSGMTKKEYVLNQALDILRRYKDIDKLKVYERAIIIKSNFIDTSNLEK